MNNACGSLVLDVSDAIFSSTYRLHSESLILQVYLPSTQESHVVLYSSVDPVDTPPSKNLIMIIGFWRRSRSSTAISVPPRMLAACNRRGMGNYSLLAAQLLCKKTITLTSIWATTCTHDYNLSFLWNFWHVMFGP